MVQPQEMLFVLEASDSGRLFSVRADGSDKRVIVAGCRSPTGSWSTSRRGTSTGRTWVFRRSNDGSIERVDLDGSNRVTIVPSGVAFTPKQLHLEAVNRKLYWGDREGMRVMRCDLDGSNVETLVQTGQGDDDRRDQTRWCVGVAVDPARGHLYWTQKGPSDAGLGKILRARVDVPPAIPRPIGATSRCCSRACPSRSTSSSTTSGMLYWTDRGDPPRGNTVNRAPIDAAHGRSEPEILLTHLMEGIGIALDPGGDRMFVTDLGGTIYMARLDGSTAERSVPQGNLTGIAYAELPLGA